MAASVARSADAASSRWACSAQQGPPQRRVPRGAQAVESIVYCRAVGIAVGVQAPRPAGSCLHSKLRGQLLDGQRR